MQYSAKYDTPIVKEEPITDEERIAMIRNPELQQYLSKSERPPNIRDKDFFDFDNSSYARLHSEHIRRLKDDFAKEAEFYDHVFLDERVLTEKYKITDMSVKLKPISNEQAEFDFILGGSIKIRIDYDTEIYTLKFKYVRNNNFTGLRLGHIDFMTPGYSHPYYSDINDNLVKLIAEDQLEKRDVLVSLLYQPKLDFRPFDFGMAILDINNRQMLIKYANEEFIKNV